MAIDARLFRSIIGLFGTGVAVIATEVDERVHAMTANAVCSLSLDPTLVIFCPGKKAVMSQTIDRMRGFTINFLREEQQALSSYFAGAWKERLPPPFRFASSECGPRLEGALASLHCETHQLIDGGDHWLVIGRVLGMHQGIEPHRPLLFFKGTYRAIDFAVSAPAPDLSNVDNEPAHVFYDRWDVK